MSSSAMEYKLLNIWSIQKETFMSHDDINSRYFTTTLPGVKYNYMMSRGSNGYRNFSEIWFKAFNASINEMKLSVSSANFKGNFTIVDSESGTNRHGYIVASLNDITDRKKKFFVNDILTIEICGTLCYEGEKTKMNLGKILSMDNEQKDVTFIVGNAEYMIHYLVLQQFSSILEKNLNTIEIRIENFERYIVEAAIGLCYGQKNWRWFCQFKDFFKLLQFTNVYEMPLIKEQVEIKLIEYIKEENVCMLANKSVEHYAHKLRGYCIIFISNCIKDGKTVAGFKDLKTEIVYEVLQSPLPSTQIREKNFNLGKLLCLKKCKDFTFVVGDEKVKIHKLVLCQ